MDLVETIRTRRSVGVFTDQPVAPELVLELLEIAVWAPNHRLTEPWRFVLLTGDSAARYAEIRCAMALDACALEDEAARHQVGEGAYKKFSDIPAFLAVIMKENENPEIREEDYAACCCLVQNFLLLAWARGLGTSWKTFKRDERLRRLLELADDEIVVGWLHLGYPKGSTPPTSRAFAHERFTLLDGARES
jgi:nitroreductase